VLNKGVAWPGRLFLDMPVADFRLLDGKSGAAIYFWVQHQNGCSAEAVSLQRYIFGDEILKILGSSVAQNKTACLIASGLCVWWS